MYDKIFENRNEISVKVYKIYTCMHKLIINMINYHAFRKICIYLEEHVYCDNCSCIYIHVNVCNKHS